MVWLLSNWWHVAQPLPPAAWSPEQGSPCVHVLLTSSAGEVIHLKSKHRLPSPLNWLFFSARSVPQNGSLTGCRNSCAGPEERVTQAQRWYPSSFISPISQISKWSRLPDLHTASWRESLCLLTGILVFPFLKRAAKTSANHKTLQHMFYCIQRSCTTRNSSLFLSIFNRLGFVFN